MELKSPTMRRSLQNSGRCNHEGIHSTLPQPRLALSSVTSTIHDVCVYPIVLGFGGTLPPRLLSLLDEFERSRFERYQLRVVKDRFLEGHACMRLLLARLLAVSPDSIRYSYNRFGKPFLASHPYCKISVAHSGQMMLLAAANNCDLGIDIEAIDNRTDRDAIVKRFFTHQEQLDYASNPEPDRPAAFLRAWTRKEAYLKARGDGLTIALNSF